MFRMFIFYRLSLLIGFNYYEAFVSSYEKKADYNWLKQEDLNTLADWESMTIREGKCFKLVLVNSMAEAAVYLSNV